MRVQGSESPKVASERTGADRFKQAWAAAYDDATFRSYVNEHLPQELTNVSGDFNQDALFSPVPDVHRPFVYDAVTSLAVSMCRAGQDTEFFNGSAVYEEFVNIDFNGASGRVLILPSGSRDNSTLSFSMEHARPVDNQDGTIRFEVIQSYYFEGDKWNSYNRPFYFAGNQTVAPSPLPPVDFEYNYIGTTARALGYCLMAMAVITALLSGVWTVIHFSTPVVQSSHPLFLAMIIVGTVVMASTIIPLSMEETTVDSVDGLDVACMSTAWLYIVGVNIVLAGLMAKARTVYKVSGSCIQLRPNSLLSHMAVVVFNRLT
jgi:7 transmembrane sweet-taste receptor of 3 GCPR